jgi:hypothetical protein
LTKLITPLNNNNNNDNTKSRKNILKIYPPIKFENVVEFCCCFFFAFKKIECFYKHKKADHLQKFFMKDSWLANEIPITCLIKYAYIVYFDIVRQEKKYCLKQKWYTVQYIEVLNWTCKNRLSLFYTRLLLKYSSLCFYLTTLDIASYSHGAKCKHVLYDRTYLKAVCTYIVQLYMETECKCQVICFCTLIFYILHFLRVCLMLLPIKYFCHYLTITSNISSTVMSIYIGITKLNLYMN